MIEKKASGSVDQETHSVPLRSEPAPCFPPNGLVDQHFSQHRASQTFEHMLGIGVRPKPPRNFDTAFRGLVAQPFGA